MRYPLEFLEMMIIRPCNLSCEGCSTFSDLRWSGYLSWSEGRRWLEPWLDRIDLQAWGVMGGEPLMHPGLTEWLTGIRQILPHTQIRFVTNGLLLHRHAWLPGFLSDLGNATLKISYHIKDPQLDQTIQEIMGAFDWQPVNEYGIDRWLAPNQFRFQIATPKRFIRTFQGNYANMWPHDNDPEHAFDNCVQKRCPMLLEGQLYKCGTAALNSDVLQRFGYPNRAQWEPYLNTGISPDCSDLDLEKFIKNFGRPHAMCRQCPTADDTQSIIDHTMTVKRK